MNYFLSRIRRVKVSDIVQIWKMFIAIIPSFCLKHFSKPFWLISEAPNEARDNGFWFFKYIRENHPEQKCFYVIKSDSPDYSKISSVGPTIEFGSVRHWLFYLAAEKIISSQKAMGPNAAICNFFEVYGFLNNKRYFLQHGIVANDLEWLYYDVTKFSKFFCGAYPEYLFVSNRFGYPIEDVCYTGLCRYDGLHSIDKSNERIILIMPTWREWIADEDERLLQIEGTERIQDTEYFKTWSSFIKDNRIEKYCKDYNVKFIFFPHREMQKYLDYFPKSNEYITIAGAQDFDVQELLKRASIMITDYSSVFFDMLYMKKPVLFYQFDYDRFRTGQYSEGYFDYHNNRFGKSYKEKDKIFEDLEVFIKNDFRIDTDYLYAHREYFRLHDKNNCKRTYLEIKND